MKYLYQLISYPHEIYDILPRVQFFHSTSPPTASRSAAWARGFPRYRKEPYTVFSGSLTAGLMDSEQFCLFRVATQQRAD